MKRKPIVQQKVGKTRSQKKLAIETHFTMQTTAYLIFTLAPRKERIRNLHTKTKTKNMRGGVIKVEFVRPKIKSIS